MNPAPPVVLGLCSGTHDSAAALIVEGALVGLVEEERLNGTKHTRAYPEQSIGWLLRHAGLTPGQITHVAYNFDPRRYLAAALAALRYLAHPAAARRALPRARSFAQVYRNGRVRFQRFQGHFPGARVSGVEHHLAHGLYALAASGLDDVAVLIVDSLGETATTTISHAHHTGSAHPSSGSGGVAYRRLQTITDPASLGYAYGAVTRHLGWRRGDGEGTVMALGALGDPARFRDLFRAAIPITETGFGLDLRMFPLRVLSSRWPRVSAAFAAETCPPRPGDAPIEQIHRDVAAALQERTEQVMLHLARRARTLTGASGLVVGGSVAMNCVAIGRICEHAGFTEVAVPPAPGDSGTAAGAALAVHRDLTGRLAGGVAGACYLGPGYPQVQLSQHPRPSVTAVPIASPARMVATRLAEGQIVGLFQGRLEAGPQLAGDHSLRHAPQVTVCEAAFHPRPGAVSLLFPAADTALRGADPTALAALPRDLSLVYVGNQYDRDEAFDEFFAPTAAMVPHLVAGKWTTTSRWPQVNFTGRVPFDEVERLHRRSLATLLLTPDRLAVRGQFTQRIFEAVLAGCVPLAPAYLRSARRVVSPELIVEDADQALTVINALAATAGGPEHAALIGRCLQRLAPFRLSRQLATLSHLLDQAVLTGRVMRP